MFSQIFHVKESLILLIFRKWNNQLDGLKNGSLTQSEMVIPQTFHTNRSQAKQT